MTEFWVSTPKYWCKFCKVWLTDNKIARRNHDNGKKHKETMIELKRAKKDAELHGATSERELKQQLKDIEAAAQAALDSDLAKGGHGLYVKPGMEGSIAGPQLHRQAVPGGQRRPGDRVFVRREERERREAEEQKKQEDEAEDPGEYEVDGVRYLEAKRHETLLRAGAKVQVWIEGREAWQDAVVAQVDARQVPNTEIVVRKYALVYRLPTSAVGNGLPRNVVHVPEDEIGDLDLAHLDETSAHDEDADIYEYLEATAEGKNTAPGGDVPPSQSYELDTAVVREMEVPLERLRIVGKTAADEAATRVRAEKEAEEKKAAEAPAFDAQTGIWGWQTVKVKKVDLSKEREVREARQRQADAAGRRPMAPKDDDKSMRADDALAAYDPSGRSKGWYRGVHIGGAEDALGLPDASRDTDDASPAAADTSASPAGTAKAEGPVFKKRSRGFKATRTKRRKTSDNV